MNRTLITFVSLLATNSPGAPDERSSNVRNCRASGPDEKGMAPTSGRTLVNRERTIQLLSIAGLAFLTACSSSGTSTGSESGADWAHAHDGGTAPARACVFDTRSVTDCNGSATTDGWQHTCRDVPCAKADFNPYVVSVGGCTGQYEYRDATEVDATCDAYQRADGAVASPQCHTKRNPDGRRLPRLLERIVLRGNDRVLWQQRLQLPPRIHCRMQRQFEREGVSEGVLGNVFAGDQPQACALHVVQRFEMHEAVLLILTIVRNHPLAGSDEEG